MSGALTAYDGATIADPTTAAAIDWSAWTGAEQSGSILIHNTSSTDPVFLVTAADATVSGRGVPPGSTASFGPYLKGVAFWIVGADASPVHYSFDAIYSEGR